jgi:hypothetical protein
VITPGRAGMAYSRLLPVKRRAWNSKKGMMNDFVFMCVFIKTP